MTHAQYIHINIFLANMYIDDIKPMHYHFKSASHASD